MSTQYNFLDDSTQDDQQSQDAQPDIVRKRANDLDGATWTKYSVSIWSDIRKTKEEADLGHPAIFPSQLVDRLIECFTRNIDRIILDPFSGSGSTVVAASRMGRTGIGFEINQAYVDLTNRRLQARGLWQDRLDVSSKVIVDDARNIVTHIPPDSIDMVITSPPYWDVLSQKRSADGKTIRDYGDTIADLGKIDDYEEFIVELAAVFKGVYEVLRPEKYCAVVVMDLRKKSNFYPFHADVAHMMESLGFIYDDLFIWDRRHEYNNLRPLGYPAVFRVNKCHEYILIFQKPGIKENK